MASDNRLSYRAMIDNHCGGRVWALLFLGVGKGAEPSTLDHKLNESSYTRDSGIASVGIVRTKCDVDS